MKLKLNKVYEDEKGNQWRIVCKMENSVVVVNKNADDYFHLIEGENYCIGLLKLIGDEFTEPRYFEFEGYVMEDTLNQFSNSTWAIENQFKNPIVGPKLKKDAFNSSIAMLTGMKISKWKFTMEEIIE